MATRKKAAAEMLTYYKATRPSGCDFRTGTVDYAKALKSGKSLVHDDPGPVNGNVCGRGFHVSPTARLTCQFLDLDHQPYRWFEVQILKEYIIEEDSAKARVRRIERVAREITLADIFGPDFAQRVDAAKVEAATWKNIKWLKPARTVTDKEVGRLCARWHAAISPWVRAGRTLLEKTKIVRDQKAADAAAVDAAADAAAAAAAADADAAADVAGIGAADADADADADAADADAAAVDAAAIPSWIRWYVRPRYVLWRMARWQMVMPDKPNPWEPLVELFKLGCLPIGYSGGKFVVYVPGKAKA